MQSYELEDTRRDGSISTKDDDSDIDVQQVSGSSGRPYDPTPDKRDMQRLGKRQELKRRFRFFSIVGYVIVLGLTWEFSLVTSPFSLSNGGTAGAIWINLIVCLGTFTCVLSMAEMASMAPTSGGQYHWVSEVPLRFAHALETFAKPAIRFAPPSMQKQLSFAVGWLCALGWQAAMPSVAFIGAQQVLALISICDSDYVIKGWHGALLTMAFVLAAIFFNTSAIGKLPLLEGLAVVLHIFGFFAVVVVLWVMGPRAPAKQTFTHFEDQNNWGSVGLATLIGVLGPVATYAGGDSAVHLSEELKDASYGLPRAMISAALINYTLGFVITVTLMCNLGDIDTALKDRSGQPWVAVIYEVTGSKAATIVFLVVMIIMYFFCGVNQVTTSSRQVFAFARDKGLPFHTFLAEVRPGSGVPKNAVYVTLAFACVLALIIIGSSLAFNIILTVSCTGLVTSYIACIACVLIKRLRGEQFPPSKFKLGRLGITINTMALIYLSVTFVFLFFPAQPHPTAASMNWGVLIYGVAIIFAAGYYFIKGKHQYDGPVHYVRWQTRMDTGM